MNGLLACLNVDASETLENRLEQVNTQLEASIRTVRSHVTTIVIGRNEKFTCFMICPDILEHFHR